MDERFEVADTTALYGSASKSLDAEVVNSDKGIFPRMNYTENNEKLVIECYLSGLNRRDFHVEVNEGSLSISTKDRYGNVSFYRSIEIPDNVNADDIETQSRSGYVKFTIPKQAAARTEAAV